MYSFYIHSCWPFIELGFSCFTGRPRAEQEGFLLSTETQINRALNQINAHLKWAVSLNSLQMSTYNQFALSTQVITAYLSTLYLEIVACCCLTQAEEEEMENEQAFSVSFFNESALFFYFTYI